MIVIAPCETELGEDAADVLGDRAFGHPQTTGNSGVRATFGHKREHLALARRQLIERVVDALGRDELLNQRWVDDRTAPDDAFERLNEVVHVRDATLQQVPASLATGEETHRVLKLDMGRENENSRVRILRANRVRRLETLRRLCRWHADIDDQQVRLVLAAGPDRGQPVARLSDNVVTRALEQAGDPLPKQHVVVGNHDTSGGRAAHLRKYAMWMFDDPGAPTLFQPARVDHTGGVTETSQDDADLRLTEFEDLLTTAIENADAREAVKLLADEQAALRRIATLVATGIEPGSLFDALSSEVEALCGADISAVLRFEGDGTVTIVGAHRGPHSRGARVHLDPDYVVGAVSRTGQAARFDLKDWHGEPPAVAREWGVHSALATPVLVEGELWGAITIASLEGSLAAGTDRRLADFSALFATAIANAQSREALAALAAEQAALRRVATLVANDAPSTEIFSAVSEEVARLFDSAAGVGRFEDDSAVVYVGVVNIDIPVGSRWDFQDGMISAEVHRTGRPARVEERDWPSLTGELGAAVRRHRFSSMVGSPIFADGGLWGAIVVSSQDLLPRDTEERLERFTELIATAIANTAIRQAHAQLAEEQAALRRVATLVAHDVPPGAIFAAVTEEVAQVFYSNAAVLRFEDGAAVVFVGATNIDIPIGTRWEFQEGMASAEVYRTGRSARIEKKDWAAIGGSVGEASRRLGTLSHVGCPIVVKDHLWGAMVVGSTHNLLPPDAETRLERFTELIATAISNATARTELIESRARIVAAGDEARRTIERDLHDGTQQRLVSLALAARAAAADLPPESGNARERVSSIAAGLSEAAEELQEFSRGIHPAILSDAGLRPALEALAMRSPIPVELEVMTRERFPEPVEVAAYFVASESLANAAKHSRSSRIDVALTLENERLMLSVRDDGIGGADLGSGSGLVGLRDRVEALGGSLEIASKPGGGTTLAAVLPIGDEPGVDAGIGP